MTVPPAPEPVPVQEPVPFAMPVTVPVPPAPPEPLIEARFDADYLANPKPAYPLISRRLGEQGVVHLRVHVGTDGLPLKVEVKRSSGFERLDRCAQETVTRWRFVPAKRGSNAVASWVVVPIVFSLT
ncbi:energy transducer TonB [Parasulfuritortus cantonensis]|uniref:Energy transducer TonB n=1 Tax=Parasulfuritortus cantonensis TaxID=2528202 RepID=A0A4V2NVX2_9PROT|nr:energy transducer TonB [Parasulfuritortus cantonensis]TCJ15102.1 energy transducer TonB [Parasulfuritortus cantonensis]